MQTAVLAIAHRQLQIRNFTDAVPLYRAVVDTAPETIPAWEGLLAALAGGGQVDKALALIETRQHRFNDGLGFYVGSLTRLMASGFEDIAETLIAATPHNSVLDVVARYGARVLALRRQHAKEAAAHRAPASVMAENFSDHFRPHPFLQKIIIEGRQFQDFATLDTLMTRDRAGVIANSNIIEPAARFHDAGATRLSFDDCFAAQGDAPEKQSMRGTLATAPAEALAG